MIHTLDTKLKKSKEHLVARLNKKLKEVAQDSSPQQLSSLLKFRTPPAVLRIRRSEKNVPEVNELLPESEVLLQQSIIILSNIVQHLIFILYAVIGVQSDHSPISLGPVSESLIVN